AQAQSRNGRVDGQDQRAVAVLGGTVHEVLGAAPLPQNVDLHPTGGVGRRGSHLLERAGGQRGQDQQGPGRGGPPGTGRLTVGVGQSLERRRGGGDRRADGGAEQGRGRRNLRQPGQDVRVELPVAPCSDVALQEALVV